MSWYRFRNNILAGLFVCSISLLLPASTGAQVMQGGQYKIQSDSLNVGGIEGAESALYKVSDTIGEQGTGEGTTLLNKLKAGYRQIVDTVAQSGSGGSGGGGGGSSSSGGGGGAAIVDSGVPLSMFDLSARASENSIELSWLTNKPAYTDIRFGLDETYASGFVGNPNLVFEHAFVLPNLAPATRYYIEIALRSGTGERVVRLTALTTLSTQPAASEDVPNVTDVAATPTAEGIEIVWSKPPEIARVIIIRSEVVPGASPSEGEVVFRGEAESFLDTEVEPGKNYRYTVIAETAELARASGVLVDAAPLGTPVIDPYAEYGELTVHPKIAKLTISDFDIIQSGTRINVEGERAVLVAGEPFVVSIDYDKLPEILKTIAVTMTDVDTGEAFTFLLRVNPGKTGYRATIGALERTGTFTLSFAIVDHQNRGMKKIQEDVFVASAFSEKFLKNGAKIRLVVENLIAENPRLVFLALLLAILLVLRIIHRRISVR
jgi:hypothetical protein